MEDALIVSARLYSRKRYSTGLNILAGIYFSHIKKGAASQQLLYRKANSNYYCNGQFALNTPSLLNGT